MRTARPATGVRLVVLLLVVVLVGACTTHPEPGPPASAPAPPPTAFAALAGTGDNGSNDWVEDAESRDDEVVAVGRFVGWRSIPTFRRSTDGGRSWQEGGLTEQALAETPLASDETPSAVAPGPAGWVALGLEDRAVAWTSVDGLAWDRHALPAAAAEAATDSVADLVAGPSTYLAVGSRTVGDRTTPQVWTSADGATWVRHALPGRGSVASAAVRGSTVVAVGSSDDDPEDARIWRSVDSGATWSTVKGPPRPPEDGAFGRTLADLSATPTGFVALGSAWTDRWEPTLYASPDGERWTYDRAVRSMPHDGVHGSLLPAGDDTLAVTDTIGRFDRIGLQRRAGRTWAASTTPLDGMRLTANWLPRAVVRTRAGWSVAVVEENNGRLRGHLWFSPDGHDFTDVGPSPTRWSADALFPSTLVLDGRDPVVLGRAQGLPVVWRTAGAARPYAPMPIERDPRFSLDSAVRAGGRLLVWGSDLGGNSRYATVWTSLDGVTFERTPEGTFGKYDTYGYSEIVRVRRLGGRWAAVGEQSTNGSLARSALIATSTDGRRWTAARPAIDRTPVEGEIRRDITDLAGADDHVRTVADVVPVRGGRALAVGAASDGGELQPAVWNAFGAAGGGEVWFLQTLPLKGYASARMRWAESYGRRVVVLGTARRKEWTLARPYVWVSDDFGVHWDGGLLPTDGIEPAHLDLDGLVRTQRGYVVTGNVSDDLGRPVAWRSADGRRWEPLELVGLPTGEGHDVSLFGVTTSGTDVVGLLRDRTAAGAGTTVFRQVVP